MALAQEKLLGEWRVIQLNGAPVLPGSTPSLNFGADGRLSGNSSCNRFGAAYSVDGPKLSVSQGMGTQMACAAPLMQQEQLFLSIITGGTRWSIDDGQLSITGANQSSLRALRAK
jgi:heat shock protein HslJ